MSLIGILVALALFIFMAMRGLSVVLAALVCSVIVIFTNGMVFETAILEYFPTGKLGAFTFAGKFFLLFVAGAMFGRMMSITGAANSIAVSLINLMGAKRALIITVIITSVLTYGGVVLFVVIFTMYPLGVQLLAQANIPKRLFTGALAIGCGTFTMTAMPGSPSIHNVIPSVALGTDLFAASTYGLIASFIMVLMGVMYLERERKKAIANGETFEPNEKDNQILSQHADRALPGILLALMPIIVVLTTIIAPRIIKSMSNTSYNWVEYANSQPIIWPCIALFIGILTCVLLFPTIRSNSLRELGVGAEDAIMPLIATSVVIGFGGVVSHTDVFQTFTNWVTTTDMPLLLSVFVGASAISAIVGSSSGGLQIFMGSMAPSYLEKGIDPEMLHRIAALASGGIDSLPHSGAVVAVLAITGLTHKQAYKDIGVLTVVIPVIATLFTIGAYYLFN
ncbi:GntP family permease [Colwellia sp. MEBiC06753]